MDTDQQYCQYHDIVLCAKHKDECLGGARCEPLRLTERDAAAAGIDRSFCSVCYSVISPKACRP